MKTAVEIIDAYAHTNDPPSDVDRRQISQLVDEEDAAVASLNTRITQLHAQLVDLRSLRKKRRGTIEKLRAITSPLRFLPPEILSLIFMQCPRAEDHDQGLRNPSPRVAPLLLVRICSRWRHIALSTPMLWTDLQLILPDWIHESEDSGEMVLMNNWVVNATPLPISLAARCYSPEVLRRALTMAPRFKALRLHLSSHSMYTLGFRDHRTLQVDAEILRIHIETHQAINRRSSYSAFQNSPSLRDFTLICAISFDPAFLRFSLPWAQLTHLHIDEHLFFASMTILVRCVNLVDCTFGRLACFEEDEDVAIHERTTFPSLADAYFSFDSLDNDTTKNFLAPLILPALKKIALRSIAVVTLWGDVACAAFGSFQMRSGFNLETLELHGVNISAINLLPFLESLPALKSLKMTNIVNVYAFFRAITNDGSQYLLPQLKQLTVTFSPADNLLEAFIAMIRSRRGQSQATAAGMPAVSQLEYLHLISDKTTLPLDRWWWEWKLGILFPELELKCS